MSTHDRGSLARPRRAASLLALLLVLGCTSAREQWAEVRFQSISFQNLYQTLVDLLDAEGFTVGARDPGPGTIESEWLYGTSRREVRGPSRRKVFVRINEEDERWLVRVRVAEEVVRKGGTLATNAALRQSKDWEPWDDNYDDAEYLAAKMRALLGEHAAHADVIPTDGDGDPAR